MTTLQAAEAAEALPDIVARRTRGLLAEKRLKQQELGLAMGMSRSAISMRLSGNKEFTLGELPALASVLDTTVAYLMGLTSDAENPRPEISDGGPVRHEGLEPPTRWLSVCPPLLEVDEPTLQVPVLADVVPIRRSA